jgi:hypothetical protein
MVDEASYAEGVRAARERYAQAWADGSGESVETAAFGAEFLRAQAEELAELRALVAGSYTLAWGWNGHPDDADPQEVAPDWYQVLDADEHEVDIDVDASELVAEVRRREHRNGIGALLVRAEEAAPDWELQVVNNHTTGGVWHARWSRNPGDPLHDAFDRERLPALEAATRKLLSWVGVMVPPAEKASAQAEAVKPIGPWEHSDAPCDSTWLEVQGKLLELPDAPTTTGHRRALQACRRLWDEVDRLRDLLDLMAVDLVPPVRLTVSAGEAGNNAMAYYRSMLTELCHRLGVPECAADTWEDALSHLERRLPSQPEHHELTRLAERILRLEALLLDPAELAKEPAESLEQLRQMPGGAPLQLGRLTELEDAVRQTADAVRQTAELGDGLTRIAMALERLVSFQG